MAGQWKAKTTEISQVDSSGSITARFDVKKGANVIFPNLIINTTPATYQDDIKRKALDLVNSYNQQQAIPQSEVIDLD
jgi:hypothetical protein